MSGTRPSPFQCAAVISDVDGTLVTKDKALTPGTVEAVARLHASGIAFSVISSRPTRGLHMLAAPLQLTSPIGSFNGGVITTSDFTVLTENLLAPSIARRAVGLLDALGVEVWVFSGQEWLVRDSAAEYVGREQRTIQFPPTVVADFGAALDRAAKIVGVSGDFAHLAHCEREVGTALADDAFVARSQPYYLDITHPLANKGAAVTALAQLMGVPLEAIAVIGDGGNDIAMFEQAGYSIAMGNAGPAVKQAADVVTDGNSEDGFAHAIERFILGGARPLAPPKGVRGGVRPW